MPAPAFQSSSSFSSSFAPTITRALNAGTAAKRCVLVFATNQSSNSTIPNSATYGGVAMTAGTLLTCATTGNQGRLFWLFGDTKVAGGTNNIVVTYSDGNGAPDISAVAYSGVDDTAGVSSQTTNTSFSNAPFWTVASGTGDLVVALWAGSLGGAVTATSPAVTRLSDTLHTNVLDNFAFEQPGAASVTIAGSIAGPTPAWFGTAVSLKAAPSVATAITLPGPSSGALNVASNNFTVGANGSISGTVVVTPNDNSGGGRFTPASVSISNAVPTATFTYTPTSAGPKTIRVTNSGSLANPANLSYTAGGKAGAITTEPICNNTGTLYVSQTGATVYVYSVSTGALVVAKSGQTTNAFAVMTIADPLIAAGTQYRIVGVLSNGAEFMARYTAA